MVQNNVGGPVSTSFCKSFAHVGLYSVSEGYSEWRENPPCYINVRSSGGLLVALLMPVQLQQLVNRLSVHPDT